MPLPLTLVTHCYNEEYLLPWWLKHHYTMFDHGVVIDYASTDRSVEICRELAPSWDVVPSRNKQFGAQECDQEVMDVERRFEGWKLALNVTEFFCCRDVQWFKAFLEMDGAMMYGVQGVVLVDPDDVYTEPDPNVPLVAQRHHGFFEDERLGPETVAMRSRLFHRHADGAYEIGRHNSYHHRVMHPPGALILWCGFSPWTRSFVDRKLQIGSRIPASDLNKGFGGQHLWSEEDLDNVRRRYASFSEDLSARIQYQRVFGAWPYRG